MLRQINVWRGFFKNRNQLGGVILAFARTYLARAERVEALD